MVNLDELILSGELLDSKPDSPFFVATISEVDQTGATLIINAGMGETKKRYRHLANGLDLNKNDRVLVAKVTGTYVILGKITL